MPITLGNTSITGITGNQGIGTDSPSDLLEVAGISRFTRSGTSVRINPNFAVLDTHALIETVGGTALAFATGNQLERMRITSAGQLRTKVTGASNVLMDSFGCRAWADFDGRTSPATIRASGNISSITRRATGKYTINFATAMPDANYIFSGSVEGGSGTHVVCMDTGSGGTAATSGQKNTTSCNIYVTFSGNLTNPAQGSIMFLR